MSTPSTTFPIDPFHLRMEARDIEIGAAGPISDYAIWLRECADKIEELERIISSSSTPQEDRPQSHEIKEDLPKRVSRAGYIPEF